MWCRRQCQSADFAIRIWNGNINGVPDMGELYVKNIHFLGRQAGYGPDVATIRIGSLAAIRTGYQGPSLEIPIQIGKHPTARRKPRLTAKHPLAFGGSLMGQALHGLNRSGPWRFRCGERRGSPHRCGNQGCRKSNCQNAAHACASHSSSTMSPMSQSRSVTRAAIAGDMRAVDPGELYHLWTIPARPLASTPPQVQNCTSAHIQARKDISH